MSPIAALPLKTVTIDVSSPVQAALQLWRDGGYQRYSLADLSACVGVDVLAYPCKEALIVDLWQALNHESWSQVDELPPAHMAQRFGQALSAKLAQLSPYRAALAASMPTAPPMRPAPGVRHMA